MQLGAQNAFSAHHSQIDLLRLKRPRGKLDVYYSCPPAPGTIPRPRLSMFSVEISVPLVLSSPGSV